MSGKSIFIIIILLILAVLAYFRIQQSSSDAKGSTMPQNKSAVMVAAYIVKPRQLDNLL